MDEPKPGNYFFADIEADRLENGTQNNSTRNYHYRFIGNYPQGALYAKASPIGKFRGGLFVIKNKITKVLTPEELSEIIDSQRIVEINRRKIAEQNLIIAEEKSRLETQRKIAEEKERATAENNKKYGTSGVGMHVENISTECLVIDDWQCKLQGENYQIIASIRNNLNDEVKDIEVQCRYFSQSGTELRGAFAKNKETIYQKWTPGEIRRFKFNISKIKQTENIKCTINRWQNNTK